MSTDSKAVVTAAPSVETTGTSTRRTQWARRRGPFARRRSQTSAGLEISFAGSWRFTSVVVICAVVAASVIGAFGRYNMSVFSVACAYLVCALGYNLILGYNGQLSFGFAAFPAISGYGYAIMQQADFSTPIAFVVAVACSVIGGLVVGVAVARARHFYLALITLAFAQAVLLVISRWHSQTHGEDGIAASLNGRNTVYVSIVVAALSLLLVDRMTRSRFGRAIVMVRSDERVAEAMGVPSAMNRLAVGAIGGGLGGVGGVLLSGTLGFITPQNFSLDLTVLILTMIVVGGLGSIWGTIIGTAVIVVLNQIIANSLGWRDIIYGLVLFGALVLLPGGVAHVPERLSALRARMRSRDSGGQS